MPAYLKNVMSDIGSGDAIAPLNLFEVVGGAGPLLLAGDSWSDLEFEVALDSGSVAHVRSLEDCPGYFLAESPRWPEISHGRQRDHRQSWPEGIEPV